MKDGKIISIDHDMIDFLKILYSDFSNPYRIIKNPAYELDLKEREKWFLQR